MDELIKQFNNIVCDMNISRKDKMMLFSLVTMIGYECQKSAAPVRHGRWEWKEDPYGFFDTIPICSVCGCTTKLREEYNFCPSCGADMRGES